MQTLAVTVRQFNMYSGLFSLVVFADWQGLSYFALVGGGTSRRMSQEVRFNGVELGFKPLVKTRYIRFFTTYSPFTMVHKGLHS